MTQFLTAEQLTSLDSSELLLKLDELRHAALTVGHEMADAEKRYKDTKELLPVFLAEIQSLYMETYTAPANIAKVKALAHSEYKMWLEKANELGHAYRLKEVEYRAVIKSLEALTGIAYVRNTEMKLARG